MRIFLICWLSVALVSCASQQPSTPAQKHVASPPNVTEDVDPGYWWYARFRMQWPEQEAAPDFARDLIIANEVIAPLLEIHADDIKLWRFHRRAARDSAGHQFSFIFYAQASTAHDILDEIQRNPVLGMLIDNSILLELKLDDPARPGKADIAGTSDPSWAPSVQKSWPYFIMGVSVMFLDLLEQEIDEGRLGQISSASERLDYYRSVNDRLTQMWKEQGRHAYFHHISGIFGYEPIDMRF